MKKWILGVGFLILFFMPIPLVWHSECKAGFSRGIFYECPRLPEKTQNLWDGYFLTWRNSIAQKLIELFRFALWILLYININIDILSFSIIIRGKVNK